MMIEKSDSNGSSAGAAGLFRPVLVRAVEVSKSFSSTQALKQVSLAVRGGELHALVGANGSGKSTFVKILAGVEQADEGELLLEDRRIDARSTTPALARSAGFRFVHQDPGVFPELTVAENLAIGRGYPLGICGRIRWRQLRKRSIEDLDRAGISIPPDRILGELNAAARTLVAIARALQESDGAPASVLVLDEPTSALPAKEVSTLFGAIDHFRSMGLGILLISHRLGEIVGVADRVTVFRDGSVVADLDGSGLTHDRLVEHIVGRPIEQVFPQMPEPRSGTSILEVRHLSVGALRDVSFEVRPGEVVGVAGLLGSGRSTLMRTLFGDLQPESGQIVLEGHPVRLRSPREAIECGIGFIPEDRAREAAFSEQNVRGNLLAASISEFFVHGHMSLRRERHEARRLVAEFGIKTASEAASLFSLSGGNQQKVMVARWLRRRPRLILLDEPTQGVDVGARSDIYNLVRRAVDAGAAVLIVVSEFEELANVADRVLVLRGGRIVGDVRFPHVEANYLTDLAYAG